MVKQTCWKKGREDNDEIHFFGDKGRRIVVEKMYMNKKWDVVATTRTGRQLSRTQHPNKNIALKKATSLMKRYKC